MCPDIYVEWSFGFERQGTRSLLCWLKRPLAVGSLTTLLLQAVNLSKRFKSCVFRHIYREFNKAVRAAAIEWSGGASL